MQLLENNHDHAFAGHRGISASQRRLCSKYYWFNMHKEIKNYCQSCKVCQINKKHLNTKTNLVPILVDLIWHTIGIDWTGPLTTTKRGNRYIINAIDYYSEMLISRAAKDMTAETTAKFIFEDIICKHGLFYKMISDQGTNFESQVIEELLKLLKIKRMRSTSYHPISNGKIERLNRTLKAMLKNYVNEYHDNWDLFLQQLVYAYNTTPHETTQISPFQVVFQRNDRDADNLMFAENIDFSHENNYPALIKASQTKIRDIIKIAMLQSNKNKVKYYDQKLNNKHDYAIKDLVWITDTTMKVGQTRKFTPHFKGPYIITDIFNNNTDFELYNPNKNKKITVHYNRLKPCISRELQTALGGEVTKSAQIEIPVQLESIAQPAQLAQDAPSLPTTMNNTTTANKQTKTKTIVQSNYGLRSKGPTKVDQH